MEPIKYSEKPMGEYVAKNKPITFGKKDWITLSASIILIFSLILMSV